MQPTKYIWVNGEFVPWQEAKTHMLTHALHYGSGAFEGIRVYDTVKGPAVFRLAEHIERLFYSSAALRIELQFSKADLCQAVLEVVRRNELKQGYIRPYVGLGCGDLGVRPKKDHPVEVLIACWPWGAYLPQDSVDVKVSNFIRIHPRSTVCDAKLSGNYINSVLATLQLAGTHYAEALLLDADNYVAEGPGENIFVVKGGQLFTPQRGAILPGITRDTVMTLARDQGYEVMEKNIDLPEALSADEAFFTGTAAEVTPIRSLNDRVFSGNGAGPVTRRLKGAYLDVVYGRQAKYAHFLSFV